MSRTAGAESIENERTIGRRGRRCGVTAGMIDPIFRSGQEFKMIRYQTHRPNDPASSAHRYNR